MTEHGTNRPTAQEIEPSTAGASGGRDLEDEWDSLDSNESDDGIYRDRAHLIAVLAMHYPAVKSFNDPEEPEWMVVYIESPCGQLSWHIAPDDTNLLDHVRLVAPSEVQWDGHSTLEKFKRMRKLTRAVFQ